MPPLFELIARESGTEAREMYKVFNMGHRMEIYCKPEYAPGIVDIAKQFDVEAQVIGRVEEASTKKLTIVSPLGTFDY